jgi:transcription antitermination protein NusB
MALPRTKFREIVFQLLYSQNFQPVNNEFIPFMMNILKTTKKNIELANDRILIIYQKLEDIDKLIKKNAGDQYKIERISKVELNVLRLAIFELLYDKTIPAKVAISEALRLCRKFGNKDSTKFINAILDNEYKILYPS